MASTLLVTAEGCRAGFSPLPERGSLQSRGTCGGGSGLSFSERPDAPGESPVLLHLSLLAADSRFYSVMLNASPEAQEVLLETWFQEEVLGSCSGADTGQMLLLRVDAEWAALSCQTGEGPVERHPGGWTQVTGRKTGRLRFPERATFLGFVGVTGKIPPEGFQLRRRESASGRARLSQAPGGKGEEWGGEAWSPSPAATLWGRPHFRTGLSCRGPAKSWRRRSRAPRWPQAPEAHGAEATRGKARGAFGQRISSPQGHPQPLCLDTLTLGTEGTELSHQEGKGRPAASFHPIPPPELWT